MSHHCFLVCAANVAEARGVSRESRDGAGPPSTEAVEPARGLLKKVSTRSGRPPPAVELANGGEEAFHDSAPAFSRSLSIASEPPGLKSWGAGKYSRDSGKGALGGVHCYFLWPWQDSFGPHWSWSFVFCTVGISRIRIIPLIQRIVEVIIS